MAKDVPFTQKHQRAIMLVLVLLVVPTFGVAGPEIYGFIRNFRNPLHDAVGTFELAPGEMVGVTNKEFVEKNQQIYSFTGTRPSLEDTWEHIIEVAKARHLGLSVSDQELADQLRAIGFGSNPELYRQFVQRRGFTIPQYEKFLREYLLRDKLSALDDALPLITSDFVYERFKDEEQRFKVDYVVYPATNYEDSVGADAWTDESLEKMWEDKANVAVKQKLRLPATFTMEVAYAPFDAYPLDEIGDLASGIEVLDAEVRNLYESPEHNDRYREAKRAEEPGGEEGGASEENGTGAKEGLGAKEGEDATAGAAEDEKPPLLPFEDVKERIRREITIRKVVEKAHAEAVESKKALDREQAAAVRKAEEEAKKKAEEEAKRKAEEEAKEKESGAAPGAGGAGSEPAKDSPVPEDVGEPKEGGPEPPKKDDGLPPEPLQDEGGTPPGETKPGADPAASGAEAEAPEEEDEEEKPLEFRVDLRSIAEKYKLSVAKLERLDDKALEKAPLAEGLEVRINTFGLKDRDLTRPFMGPGGAAGFAAVTAFEESRFPELDAVKDDFRTGMRQKKAMDLANEAARDLLKTIREDTEKHHEAKKPQAIRERDARQKEAVEAARKAREEAEKKAAEEAEKKAEGGDESAAEGEGEKKPDGEGEKKPEPDGERKTPDEVPEGKKDEPSDDPSPKDENGSRTAPPPPSPPQDEPDAPLPGAAEGESAPVSDEKADAGAEEAKKVTELSEPEWHELMRTGLGETFERIVAEKGLEVASTGWLTFVRDRQKPEYANEPDAAVKYLRGTGSIKSLRVGEVNTYRDADAMAMYVVRMKEKEDPAWEEMSLEREKEIRQALLQTSFSNRRRFTSGTFGFDALAREVKLATTYRTPPPEAAKGIPRPLPGGVPRTP